MKTLDPLPGLQEPFAEFGKERVVRVLPDTVSDAEELTLKLGGKWNGSTGKALCPAHTDTIPSLSISNKPGGGVLVNCHSDCTQTRVIERIKEKGVWPEPKARARIQTGNRVPKRDILCYYYYRDEHKEHKYRVARWSDLPGQPKKFTQEKYTGESYASYQGCMTGVEPLPYMLPELLAAVRQTPDTLVFLPEGEKDVETCHADLKVVASCNSGGSPQWPGEITKWFFDLDVVILVDNDAPGRKHARDKGDALTGVARRVRVLELPGLGDKGDVTDWYEAGGTRSDLLKLTKGAVEFAEWREATIGLAEDLILSPDDPRTSAKAFLATVYKDGRLRYHDGMFYEWRQSHYQVMEHDAINGELYTFLEKVRAPGGRKRMGVPFQPDRRKVEDIIHALKALTHISKEPLPPRWLDGKEHEPVLACRNGLLNVRNQVLLPFNSEYFNVHSTGYDYLSEPPEPREWQHFLRTTFPDKDDRDSVLLLQEMIGYTLSGDCTYQKIFLSVGETRGGKGVAVHTTAKLLGNAAHVSQQLSALTHDGFKLERLIGKRLLITPDVRTAGRRSLSAQTVELLLMISGGDDLTTDRKYKGAVNIPPGCVVWILANDVPKLPDASGTIAGRFEAVRHRVSFFNREDKNLEEKLVPEYPGILKWAMEGYQRLVKQGQFTRPRNAKREVETLKRLASPAIAFYHDKCSRVEREIAWQGDIYERYTTWFTDTHQEGEAENPMSFGMHFGSLMQQEGVQRSQRKTRAFYGERDYYWIGLKLAKR